MKPKNTRLQVLRWLVHEISTTACDNGGLQCRYCPFNDFPTFGVDCSDERSIVKWLMDEAELVMK